MCTSPSYQAHTWLKKASCTQSMSSRLLLRGTLHSQPPPLPVRLALPVRSSRAISSTCLSSAPSRSPICEYLQARVHMQCRCTCPAFDQSRRQNGWLRGVAQRCRALAVATYPEPLRAYSTHFAISSSRCASHPAGSVTSWSWAAALGAAAAEGACCCASGSLPAASVAVAGCCPCSSPPDAASPCCCGWLWAVQAGGHRRQVLLVGRGLYMGARHAGLTLGAFAATNVAAGRASPRPAATCIVGASWGAAMVTRVQATGCPQVRLRRTEGQAWTFACRAQNKGSSTTDLSCGWCCKGAGGGLNGCGGASRLQQRHPVPGPPPNR